MKSSDGVYPVFKLYERVYNQQFHIASIKSLIRTSIKKSEKTRKINDENVTPSTVLSISGHKSGVHRARSNALSL